MCGPRIDRPGEITITLSEDGSYRLDSRQMNGTEASITKDLQSLACEVGGNWEVEKHVPGSHVRTHEAQVLKTRA